MYVHPHDTMTLFAILVACKGSLLRKRAVTYLLVDCGSVERLRYDWMGCIMYVQSYRLEILD